ncbi:hypothetical protein [Alishewanella longhuensis]
MKPLAVLSALEYGNANLKTVVDVSPGFMRIGGSWVRDPNNYGSLSLAGIIRKIQQYGCGSFGVGRATSACHRLVP